MVQIMYRIVPIYSTVKPLFHVRISFDRTRGLTTQFNKIYVPVFPGSEGRWSRNGVTVKQRF